MKLHEKKFAIFFVFALVFSLTVTPNIALAKKEKYEYGSWKIRYDTTTSPYGCSKAPGGTVSGKHINFHIYDKKDNELQNLHIWLDYLPKIYVSEGSWCLKLDKTTWKKLFQNSKVKDYLKGRLSNTAVKALINSLEDSSIRFMPLLIVVPDCENVSRWNLYERAFCSLGTSGKYQYTA